MASSQFNVPQRIKYIDVGFDNFAIGASGYTKISNPTTPSGYELLTTVVYKFLGSGAVPQVEGRGFFIYGTPSTTYNRIELRFIYVTT